MSRLSCQGTAKKNIIIKKSKKQSVFIYKFCRKGKGCSIPVSDVKLGLGNLRKKCVDFFGMGDVGTRIM